MNQPHDDALMRAELLPCPFCGGEAQLTERFYEASKIWCGKCEIHTNPYKTTSLAITAWNTRTPHPVTDAQLVEENQRLREALEAMVNTYPYVECADSEPCDCCISLKLAKKALTLKGTENGK